MNSLLPRDYFSGETYVVGYARQQPDCLATAVPTVGVTLASGMLVALVSAFVVGKRDKSEK